MREGRGGREMTCSVMTEGADKCSLCLTACAFQCNKGKLGGALENIVIEFVFFFIDLYSGLKDRNRKKLLFSIFQRACL